MKKPVDLRAVTQARRNLKALKVAYPELVGPSRIGQWIGILEKDQTMETQQTAFRLPVELLKRLDRHVRHLQEESPGMTFTRTDVIRMMLTKFLDDAEEKMPKRSSKSKR